MYKKHTVKHFPLIKGELDGDKLCFLQRGGVMFYYSGQLPLSR